MKRLQALLLALGSMAPWAMAAAPAHHPHLQAGVVIAVDLGDDVQVLQSDLPDCGSYPRESLRKVDLGGLEQAIAGAALAYFQRSGLPAQVVAPPGSGQDALLELQRAHPGKSVLLLGIGSALSSPVYKRDRGKFPEWFVGRCTLRGAGLVRNAGGQAASLMLRVSFHPPGARKPLVREFSGFGARRMDSPTVDTRARVADEEIEASLRHLASHADAGVASLLDMYFGFALRGR